MSLFMSDDPVLDAERYMRAQDIRLAKRPVCSYCKRHIQDDEAVHLQHTDFWLCLECVEDNTELIEVD